MTRAQLLDIGYSRHAIEHRRPTLTAADVTRRRGIPVTSRSRTAERQENDARRDQHHIANGFTPLRFTHGQIRYEPRQVEATLRAVVRRLELGQ